MCLRDQGRRHICPEKEATCMTEHVPSNIMRLINSSLLVK